MACGVVDGDLGALQLWSCAATSRAGESRMSSVFGLKAAPEHGDPRADEGAAAQLAGQVDHAVAAAQC